MTIYESSPSAREKTSLVAPGRLEDWHRLNHSFVALSGSYSENVTDTSGPEAERLEGRRVAPRFFIVHAMPPLAGRFFSQEEELPTGPAAAVISEGFWTRRFQRDPQALGRPLTIGGQRIPIVGVMPARFTNTATDVWLPAKINAYLLGLRNARFVNGIGRLKPGVSVAAGAGELASLQSALGKEFPKTDAGWLAEVRPLKDARIGDSYRGLVLVFGAVASLWAIAVANIAGLTLVQVQRRAREYGGAAALGASRARVIGTVIREGLLIAFFGGALGGALASWLVSAMPSILTRTPRINELAFDWRALAFVAATSVVAACVFSLVPAFMGTRPQLNRTIATGSRGVAGGHHRLQRLLVVGQVALSMLLVGSATLLLRSYDNLTKVETGFDAADVVTFQVGARWDEDRARIGQLQERLVSNLEQLPHVQAAGLTSFLPATGATLRYQVKVDGLPGTNEDGSLTAGTRTISAGYLRAIRARLVAGILVSADDGRHQGADVGDREPELHRRVCARPEPRGPHPERDAIHQLVVHHCRRDRQSRRRRPRRQPRACTSTPAPLPAAGRTRTTRCAHRTRARWRPICDASSASSIRHAPCSRSGPCRTCWMRRWINPDSIRPCWGCLRSPP